MRNAAFSRAFEGILRRLGRDALLRGGAETTRVLVEYDVQMVGVLDDQQASTSQTVAKFRAVDDPRPGDSLAIGRVEEGVFVEEERYRVDGPPLKADGVSVQVALLRVSVGGSATGL